MEYLKEQLKFFYKFLKSAEYGDALVKKTIHNYCFSDKKVVILHPNLKRLSVGKFIENNIYTFHYITKN